MSPFEGSEEVLERMARPTQISGRIRVAGAPAKGTNARVTSTRRRSLQGSIRQTHRIGQDETPGRLTIGHGEALELYDALTIVIGEIEDAGVEELDVDCARALTAGPFPLAKRLLERLEQFAVTASPTDVFLMSDGEAEIATKTAECADAIMAVKAGRVTGIVIGGTAAAAALIFLIL